VNPKIFEDYLVEDLMLFIFIGISGSCLIVTYLRGEVIFVFCLILIDFTRVGLPSYFIGT